NQRRPSFSANVFNFRVLLNGPGRMCLGGKRRSLKVFPSEETSSFIQLASSTKLFLYAYFASTVASRPPGGRPGQVCAQRGRTASEPKE
ncbi:hypothetical protein RRG08_065305, partial [Elysia crispata]